MEYVFLLLHAKELSDGSDDVKNIGVYSTKKMAQSALKRASILSDFSDYIDGFYIAKCKLNRSGWTEGYFTYTP